MAWYDREEKNKIIIKGLKKLGLTVEHGNSHDVAICPKSEQKTTVPRHAKSLNKFTVGSICNFLLENQYTEDQIKKAFKW